MPCRNWLMWRQFNGRSYHLSQVQFGNVMLNNQLLFFHNQGGVGGWGGLFFVFLLYIVRVRGMDWQMDRTGNTAAEQNPWVPPPPRPARPLSCLWSCLSYS